VKGSCPNEAEEDVLSPDEVVVEALCLLAGERHDLSGPVRESVEHAVSSFFDAAVHRATNLVSFRSTRPA
jgi:hypothetical protein